MIKEAIQKIVGKHDLTYEEAYCVMNEIMSGKTSPTENAAYLAALSTKSAKAETTAEIAGSAAAMREHALAVEHPGIEVLEIVGTGGDHAGSINISTTASFIIAAAGIAVAKHGNRAASSKSGAADCLDEISISAPTKVSEFKDGWYKTYTIAPEDFGLERAEKTAIVGGMAKENAAVTRAILTGAQGAKTDIVLLNAGAAIYIGGKADSIKEGVEKARALIESGAAEKKLQEFIEQSNA